MTWVGDIKHLGNLPHIIFLSKLVHGRPTQWVFLPNWPNKLTAIRPVKERFIWDCKRLWGAPPSVWVQLSDKVKRTGRPMCLWEFQCSSCFPWASFFIFFFQPIMVAHDSTMGAARKKHFSPEVSYTAGVAKHSLTALPLLNGIGWHLLIQLHAVSSWELYLY